MGSAAASAGSEGRQPQTAGWRQPVRVPGALLLHSGSHHRATKTRRDACRAGTPPRAGTPAWSWGGSPSAAIRARSHTRPRWRRRGCARPRLVVHRAGTPRCCNGWCSWAGPTACGTREDGTGAVGEPTGAMRSPPDGPTWFCSGGRRRVKPPPQPRVVTAVGQRVPECSTNAVRSCPLSLSPGHGTAGVNPA